MIRTVGELIKELQKWEDDCLVRVNDYWNPVAPIERVYVDQETHKDKFYVVINPA